MKKIGIGESIEVDINKHISEGRIIIQNHKIYVKSTHRSLKDCIILPRVGKIWKTDESEWETFGRLDRSKL